MRFLVKEEDRIKESETLIDTTGDGTKFLSDDGTYRVASSGGGTGSMKVIEYDPSLPENKNSRNIRLTDFISVDDSCTITENYIEVNLEKVKRVVIKNETGGEVTKEYVLAILDSIPNELEINADYDNYQGALLNFGFKRQESPFDTFVPDVVYGNERWNYNREFLTVSLEEWLEETGTTSIVGNFKFTDPFSTSPGMVNSSSLASLKDLESLDRTYKKGAYINLLFSQTGTKNKEELISWAKAMGYYTPEFEELIEKAEKATGLFLESKGEENLEWYSPIPTTANQIYIMILSESLFGGDQEDSVFEEVRRFNISIQGEQILEWYLPEKSRDGDLLEIKGDCFLLGHSLQEGDYLLIIDNKTKGIKLKGA